MQYSGFIFRGAVWVYGIWRGLLPGDIFAEDPVVIFILDDGPEGMVCCKFDFGSQCSGKAEPADGFSLRIKHPEYVGTGSFPLAAFQYPNCAAGSGNDLLVQGFVFGKGSVFYYPARRF